MSEEKKTYILNLTNGDVRKIIIPATWKITFGNLLPFAPDQRHSGLSKVALRIYEGKDTLRAVMTDVVSFRESGIDLLEKRTTIKRKAAQKQSSKGLKDVVVEAHVTEWVDPDAEDGEPDPEYLTLTHQPEIFD